MAEGGYRERFIEIERQASTLLDELEAVQSAASQYTAAGKSLESASANLGQIAERSQGLIQEVGHLASTLDKIGGGELLARQGHIEGRIAELIQELVTLQKERIPKLITSIEERIVEVGQELATLQNERAQELAASVRRLQAWLMAGLALVALLSGASIVVSLL